MAFASPRGRCVLDPNDPINNRLGGKWLLGDGTSLFRDLSPYQNNGKGVNAPSLGASHHGGLANVFNGTNRAIDLGVPAAFSHPGPIKVGAWVTASSFPGSSSFQTLFDSGFVSSTNTDGFYCRLHGAGFECGTYFGGSTAQASWTYTGWSANVWHYVEGGYDGKQWFINFDGVTKATNVNAQGPANYTSVTHVTIGAQYSGSYGVLWAGSIDDVTIWTGAAATSRSAPLYDEPYAGIYEQSPRWRVGTAGVAATIVNRRTLGARVGSRSVY